MNMKKELTKNRFHQLMVLWVMVGFLLFTPTVYSQNITIVTEPAGPLYVGDTIEVEYTANTFSAEAVFYLIMDGDTILDSNNATTGTLTGVVPEGYDPSAALAVHGIVGDVNGQEEITPIFGELSLAGTNSSYDYYEDNYFLNFDLPGIRRVQFPPLNLVSDSAVFEFWYAYLFAADTLELIVEYSTNGGTSFTSLDTIENIPNWTWVNYEIGLPANARTSSTILRVRQLDSNIENSNYGQFYLDDMVVKVGEVPIEEGVQLLAGSPFAIDLPYTNVTNVSGPGGDPYFNNMYSGDSVILQADVVGFTADTKFEVALNNTGNIDDPVYRLRNVTSEEVSPGIMRFEGKLPTHMPFNTTHYFWLVPYKGATYAHGSSISYNFAASGTGDHTITGEDYIDGSYGIYFTASNIREMVTDDYIISDAGTISVNLSRAENVFSPDNTEIVVEYSKDEGVTYAELGTVSLNEMNVYTSGSTAFEFDLPAAAVSNNTRFRVRQNEINSENLDRFYLHSYSVMMNTNRFTEGLNAEYVGNWDNGYINTPVIDLRPIDVPTALFYPGTAMHLDFVVTLGEFDANTKLNALITDPDPDILIGEIAASDLGTINATVPAIYGGSYTVRLQAAAPQGNVMSNTRSVTIEQVELQILDVTGNPDREINGTPYYFAGDEIIVDYNLVGSAVNGVQLQIQDSNYDYVTIATDDPADEQMTATIPTDFALAPNPAIRLALGDMIYNTSWLELYNRYTGPDFPENENDSAFTVTQGLINPQYYSINEATFALAGIREFQTVPFSLTNRGFVDFYFNILDEYYAFEKKVNKVVPILFQYSTDLGTTWVTLGSVNPLDYSGNRTEDNRFYYLPFEAISEQTMFRMVQNEENILEFGENAWEFLRLRVYSSPPVTLISNLKTLNLQQATISMGTLSKTVFGPGEAVTIPYNIVGNFANDIGFAAVLEDSNNELHLVATSDETGLVQLQTNMPVNLPETYHNGDSYDLQIWPFQKSAGVDQPVFGYMEDFDDDDTDAIAIEGGSKESWGYYMYENGRRSVLTKALPELEGEFVNFDFYVWFNTTLFPSEGVVVEVTHDGGANFTPVDTITSTGNYSVEIPTAEMTNQSHLRFIQYVNFGAWEKYWQLQNMTYSSEESNILTTGYLSLNQPINIEIDYPSYPSQFEISGQEDVIYSGETMDLELAIPEGVTPFPATAEYLFYLGDLSNNVVMDQNGDPILLGTLTGTGTATLDIPVTVFKDNYRVLSTVQVDDPENVDPYIYYEMVNIMNLAVYNPLLKTISATAEAYRGDDITVNWELQTGSINTADYWFHLMVNDDIIYTQKDAPVSFVHALPTDIGTGNRDVMILATTDSIYSEGDMLYLDQYNDEEWVDQGNMYIADYSYLRFNQTAATNRVVSDEFDVTNGGKVTFQIDYGNTGNEFLESNKVVFEYSLDGGETYTGIDFFPNEEYELGDGYEDQSYYFGKDVLNETTKFRFRRQNGNYGYAYVRNFVLTQWSNEAPLDFAEDQISILIQDVELGSLPESTCPGSTINLDYEIMGMFGEKVSHQLQYSVNGGGYNTFPNYEVIGVTGGTGSFEVKLPDNFNGGDYKFRLYTYDATTENSFSLYSLPTEDEMYLIPVINFTGTTLSSDQTLCEDGVKSYWLYNTQPYFVYQARDIATGELHGDPVSSEYGGTQRLFTETVTSNLELEIFVQSMSADGMTTCASGLLNDKIEFVMVPERQLFMDDNTTSLWTLAEASYSICEGNPQGMRLEAGYYNMNGSYVSSGITSITWYRNDMNNAVSSATQLSTFSASGSYFAEVLVDGCKYTTDAVDILVLSVPEKPTVTATGALTFCEGESVTLSADETFHYYRWYGGSNGSNMLSGSSQSISVLSDGAYRLQVSHYPIEQGCLSALSDPIIVSVIEDPETYIGRYTGGTMVSENNYVTCGDDMFLRVYNAPSSYTWTLNGAEYGAANDYNANYVIRATETGYYNVRSQLAQKGVTCVFTTPDSIFVQISEEIERPEITLTGDEIFCSGAGSATLTATAGYEGYTWFTQYDGDGFYGVPLLPAGEVAENTVSIEETGTYYVTVSDEFGCESEESNTISITVLPLPNRFSNVNAMDYTLCGPGKAQIQVTDYYPNNRVLVYQLMDMSTGQMVGDPATRITTDDSQYVMLESDSIFEATEFAIMVYDQNAEGCEVMLEETVVIDVNLAEVIAVGNMLYATPGAQNYQWYRNDEPIMGTRGRSSSLEVFDNAEYSVTLVYGFDCILSSDAGNVKNLTGIENMLSNDNVLVYPNPVKEMLWIDLNNSFTGEIMLEITNITGQVVKNQLIDKQDQFMKISIGTEELEKGVYFINFITEGQSLVKSIVKQ